VIRARRIAARWGLAPSALPSGEAARHATWLELFFDLVFVLALQAVQNRFVDATPDAGEVLWTAGLFIVVFWAWAGQAFYDTRFDPDDVRHRLAVLVGMLGAGTMAIGAQDAPDTRLLPIGYLVVRGTLLALYLRVRNTSPVARELTTVYLVGYGSGWLIWAASLAVPAHLRPLLWLTGFTAELLTLLLGRRWLARRPIHPSHLPERLGQFTIILLGLSLADLIDAVPSRPSIPVIAAAATAFVTPAAVWWIYTTYVSVGVSASRLGTGLGYASTHGLVGAGLLLLGWCLGQTVRQVAEGAAELPAMLRLLLTVSIVSWMVGGLILQRIALGRIPRPRLVLAPIGIGLVTALAFVPDPLVMLPLLAAVQAGYAVLATRLIIRFGGQHDDG